jgi:hypothetical protein
MTTPKTTPEVGGMGHSIKRKEDPRFIRGKGTYVDDVVLPGMLYLDIVRSPHAHAKIVKIDTAKAMAVPGVLAVITGADLAKYNLHWMPTLMSDTQMVLPVEKVMYQAQEVAAVLATTRYAAADGAAAVEVDYDPLPAVVSPQKALEPGAPVLRTDKKDKKDNHIWHWEWGDRAATDAAFSQADVVVKEQIYIPRIHVASIETCGCVAHFDKVNDKLTVWMTTQAPHAIRTVFALVAGHVGLAEHKIRIISPDIGGGFGGKVPVYPGYVIAVAASVLTGKPVKWIEDRMENLQADSFARDYHITAELAAKKDGTMTAVRIKTLADHGYTDAAANPSKFPAGLFHVCTGSYDIKAAHVEVDGAYTNKPPGGIAYRCSFRVTEAGTHYRANGRHHGASARPGPRGVPHEEFHQAGAIPLQVGAGLGVRQRQLRGRAREGHGHRGLRRAQARAGGEAQAGRAHGHRHLELHRDRGRRPLQALRHPRPQDVRLLRDPRAPDRQGHRALRHQVAGPGPRDDVRPDPRRGAGHPRQGHPGRGGRHRHRAVWPRHLREPLDPRRGRRRRHRVAQDPGQGAEARRAPPRGRARRSRLRAGQVLGEGRAQPLEDHPGLRVRRLHQSPARAWRRGSRRCPTTIRRTSPTRSGATSAWWTSTRAPAR